MAQQLIFFKHVFGSIKNWYDKMVNIGVFDTLDADLKKKIRLLNIYTLIWLHIIFMFLLTDYLAGIFSVKILITHSFSFLVMQCVLELHRHRKYNAAKHLWTVFSILHFFFISSILSMGWYLEYYFLLLPCFALSLYNNLNVSRVVLVISFILFLFPYYVFPIYPIENIEKLEVPSVFCVFCTLYLLIRYFKKINLKNEQELHNDKKLLEKQQKELETLNEFKSHFFVNLSHEIRTPITLIKGYTAKIDFKKTEAFNNEQLSVVNEQLAQIQSIVDTIMDLGKMDENKLILNKKTIALHGFLNKCYADFKMLYEKKNIDFSIQLPKTDVLIYIDDYQMERSISNLLSNALKFTPNKGKVVLYATHINGLEIGVLDNGVGIKSADIDKVFDRFYQSKNDITLSQGSGIGLSFSKNIVEEHGFSITAESEPNIETIFKIKISEIHISSPSEHTIKPLTYTSKKQILIVDDHQQMRSYIKSLLPDFYIIEAENGLEAKQIVEKEQIDLIITDYMMPVMNGYEFVDTIKKLGYKIPVIVITARGDHEGKLNMLRLGIDTYLIKPFLEEELLYSINRSLQFYNTILSSEEDATVEELNESSETSDLFHKELLEIISEKYSFSDFGIDDLAESLNMAKRTLNRKSKLTLGQTPNQLIIEFRLQKAKEILEETPDISKRKLAQKVGLSNASYLSKRMDERFGKINGGN